MQDTQFRTFSEMVRVLAPNVPHALLMDAWRRLDRALSYYFVAWHGDSRPGRYLQRLTADARVPPDSIHAIDKLRHRRNEVAHGTACNLTSDEAANFAERALDLSWKLICAVPDDLAQSSGASRVA